MPAQSDYILPPGIIQDGAITNITKTGDYWQYCSDGVQFLVHAAYPNYIPAVIDTPFVDVALRNGQSWNTQTRTPLELNLEDPTGDTRRRMDNYDTAEFMLPRCERSFNPPYPWDNRAIKRRAYSNDGPNVAGSSGKIVGFRHWKPGIMRTYDGGREVDFFTGGDIASLARQYFLRLLHQKRHGLISLQAGMAGKSEELFLKPGSSFAGSNGPVFAELLEGNANHFFTNDTIAMGEIQALINSQWFKKKLTFSLETFDQGGAGTPQLFDDKHFLNFLNQRRADVNSRGLPCLDGTSSPWLLVPIGFASSKEVDQGWQAIDQCDWSDANLADKNLAVGPFYHLKLLQEKPSQSAIHGTAMHNLRKWMMVGLLEACCLSPAWGRVDRFKITGVNHFSGANKLTLTVNSPSLVRKPIVVDTVEVAARNQYGFTVKKASTGENVPVVVTVNGNSLIDLSYAPGSLGGESMVLLDYAGFGIAQPDVPVGQATQSACQGNIRKDGIFSDPISLLPIDFWLSPYRKFIAL